MKTIVSKILAHDKLKHFFIGSGSIFLFEFFSPINSTIIGLTLFWLWEVKQKVFKDGNPEFLDWFYSSIPTLIYLYLYCKLG